MSKVLRKILPHPLLSVALLVVWLLMTSPVGTGQLTIAIIVALLVPQVMQVLEPSTVKVRNPMAILLILWRWGLDMLVSNAKVAMLILGQRNEQRTSGFVHIPLQCSNRYALACLAIIITSTPGTSWVQYDRYSRVLLLHVLDLQSGEDWQKILHDRYVSLLLEIFP